MDTRLGEAVPSGQVQRQIGPVHEPSSRRFVDFEGLEIALVRKATVSASERPLPFLQLHPQVIAVALACCRHLTRAWLPLAWARDTSDRAYVEASQPNGEQKRPFFRFQK